MTDAILKFEDRGSTVPLPPYDAEHLQALGKIYCAQRQVSDDLFEDAVQEFVLGGLTAAKRLDASKLGSARKYQHKYGEHYVSMFLTRERKHRGPNHLSIEHEIETLNDVAEFVEAISDETVVDPLDAVIQNEEIRQVRASVRELSAEDNTMLRLWLDYNWSYRKLGNHFGLSPEGARLRMVRILKTIREWSVDQIPTRSPASRMPRALREPQAPSAFCHRRG